MQFHRRSLLAASLGLGVSAAPAFAKTKAIAATPTKPAASGMGLVPDSGLDQTDALQRLIDEAANRKIPLVLPAGELILRTIEVRPNLRLSGAAGSTVLKFAGQGAMLVGTSVDNLRIEGLTLDGNLKPLDAARAKGLITIDGGIGLLIHDVSVRDSLLSGIVLDRCSGRVERCNVTAVADAAIISTDARGLDITGNTITNAGNNGILVWKTGAGEDGTKVTDNRIEKIAANNGGSGQNGNGVNVFRAGNVMVSGNRIADCAFTAVRGNAASNIQMVGNNCSRLGEVALYAEFGFQGALIASNIIDNAATGISVTNFNEGGRLAVIQGNLIRNLFRREAEPVDKRGDGIAVEADAVVTGNTIENAPGFGVLIGWGRFMREVSATSNLIRNANVGIGVSGDVEAGCVLIANNMLSGAKNGAIRAHRQGQPYGPDLALKEADSTRVVVQRNIVS